MTGLSLYNFRSNFLDLENDVIWVFCEYASEERRRIDKMISSCIIRLLIVSCIRKNQYIPKLGGFYKNEEILLGGCLTVKN